MRVDLKVGSWIGYRSGHSHLRRKVIDLIGIGYGLAHGRLVTHITAEQLQFLSMTSLQPFQIFLRTGPRYVVKDQHRLATRQQTIDQVRSYKATPTGY
jgi:hypothetical protein